MSASSPLLFIYFVVTYIHLARLEASFRFSYTIYAILCARTFSDTHFLHRWRTYFSTKHTQFIEIGKSYCPWCHEAWWALNACARVRIFLLLLVFVHMGAEGLCVDAGRYLSLKHIAFFYFAPRAHGTCYVSFEWERYVCFFPNIQGWI